MSEWISLKDALPEVYEPVLVLFLPTVTGAVLMMDVNSRLPGADNSEPRFAHLFDGCKPAYWMPLPEPPEEMRG